MSKWGRGDKLLLLILLSCVLQAVVADVRYRSRIDDSDETNNNVRYLTNTIESWKLERKILSDRYKKDHEEIQRALQAMQKKAKAMDKFCDDAMRLLRQEVK